MAFCWSSPSLLIGGCRATLPGANQISAGDLALVAAAQGPRYLAHLEAWVSHVPQPGRHRLVMFRAAGPAADSVDGWQALSAQPLEIVSVPGEHATLLGPPHVGTLAKRLAGFLSESV